MSCNFALLLASVATRLQNENSQCYKLLVSKNDCRESQATIILYVCEVKEAICLNELFSLYGSMVTKEQ